MPAGAPLVGSPATRHARRPTEAGLRADCLAAAGYPILEASSRHVTGVLEQRSACRDGERWRRACASGAYPPYKRSAKLSAASIGAGALQRSTPVSRSRAAVIPMPYGCGRGPSHLAEYVEADDAASSEAGQGCRSSRRCRPCMRRAGGTRLAGIEPGVAPDSWSRPYPRRDVGCWAKRKGHTHRALQRSRQTRNGPRLSRPGAAIGSADLSSGWWGRAGTVRPASLRRMPRTLGRRRCCR